MTRRKTATSRDACATCGEPTGGPWIVCSEECLWLLETGERLAREREEREWGLPHEHGSGSGAHPRADSDPNGTRTR